MIIAAAAGSSSEDSDPTSDDSPQVSESQPSDQTDKPTAEEEPAGESSNSTGPTADLPIQDGDWRLDTIRVKDDGLGDFSATGRVSYTGSNPAGGTNVFTLTIFVDGKEKAALTGSADDVKPGDAETVQFISSDKFVGGDYEYDFQGDL